MPLILVAESLREDDGDGEMSDDRELAIDAMWQAAERLASHGAGERLPTGPRSLRRLLKLLSRVSGAKVSKKLVRNRREDLGHGS